MIGASKILTVSYGTFSCTLEGFDEPFNTMKAIAEYFRDLAAEDRYFGAEPPTPDAAMLHKIAEREIHRRVEAKIQENGVILRTGEALDAPAPFQATPFQAAPAQPAPSQPASIFAPAPALPAPFDYDEQPLLTDASVSAESVAAKLSKLRASAAAAVAVVAVSDTASDGYTEDQHADEAMINTLAKTAQEQLPTADLIADQAIVIINADQSVADIDCPAEDFAEVSWTDDALAESESDTKATEAAAPVIAVDADYDDDADQPETLDDLSDVTDIDAQDDLLRLDGSGISDLDDLSTISIGDHNNALNDQSVDVVAETDTLPTDATLATDAMAVAADDKLLASLGNLISENDQFDRATLDDDFEDEFDGVEDSFADDAPLADDFAGFLPDAPDAVSETPAEDAPTVAATSVPEDLADEPAEPEVVQRARARVIKIRRADAPVMATDPTPQPQPALSDEAEAALQAELAALEAELAPAKSVETAKAAFRQSVEQDIDHDADFNAELAEIAAEIATTPAQPVRPQRPVRSINVARPVAGSPETTANLASAAQTPLAAEMLFSQLVAQELLLADDAVEPRHDIEGDLADEAVGRLMAQTNSALDGADIKRRQSAIAHLKAAVAATEADRLIMPNLPKDDLIDSYRSDLESVVRPARPGTGDGRVANADRPQPLVLVSAQRIDRLPRLDAASRPETAPRIVSPVRPRRIAAGPMAALQDDRLFGATEDDLDEDEGLDDAAVNMFAETESFADFADRLGASDLQDLLEAAAVYCASVLGRPEFSRPLVLRQISTLPATADLSREDGLRVFGTLLRQGRIAKTRRGQFAVTDRSPLLAEALRSAG